MPDKSFENEIAASRGWTVFCGVDEAGRGPLAGPVVAAAVLLGDEEIEGLNDSKQLTERRREKLYDEIVAKARAWAVASVDVDEIESTDILSATMHAMRQAIAEVNAKVPLDGALIDGNQQRNFPVPAKCVVKGDATCPSIAAASIIAKVTRDRYVVDVLDKQYPGYGFAKHKGYGAKAHFDAIDRLGPCPAHRMSFLQKHFSKSQLKPKTRGELGEQTALDYLRGKGYRPIERNARSKFGEIDLIVEKDGEIVFVEVKMRNNARFAEAREFVDAHKQSKLRKTAELWLQNRGLSDRNARFDVIEVYPPHSSLEKEEIIHIENAF